MAKSLANKSEEEIKEILMAKVFSITAIEAKYQSKAPRNQHHNPKNQRTVSTCSNNQESQKQKPYNRGRNQNNGNRQNKYYK